MLKHLVCLPTFPVYASIATTSWWTSTISRELSIKPTRPRLLCAQTESNSALQCTMHPTMKTLTGPMKRSMGADAYLRELCIITP
ncbi:hypothetical protein C8Q76DRAFT_369671 [Earliella scabrosa]|nr:hypothetical protein C8Q76DRAFT_369671 [Earliella scabrosa]